MLESGLGIIGIMNPLVTLPGFPRNKDKFLRLIDFFKEVLDICDSLGIAPIVDGSLAVFVYTKNSDLVIGDIDAGFPETEFPKMIKILEEKGIDFKLMEWHVLRVLRDDLKIELGSVEYWYKDLPLSFKTLQIDDRRVKILSLDSLIEFYRMGMEDRAKKADEDENERVK